MVVKIDCNTKFYIFLVWKIYQLQLIILRDPPTLPTSIYVSMLWAAAIAIWSCKQAYDKRDRMQTFSTLIRSRSPALRFIVFLDQILRTGFGTWKSSPTLSKSSKFDTDKGVEGWIFHITCHDVVIMDGSLCPADVRTWNATSAICTLVLLSHHAWRRLPSMLSCAHHDMMFGATNSSPKLVSRKTRFKQCHGKTTTTKGEKKLSGFRPDNILQQHL